jgi:hypothetical protein
MDHVTPELLEQYDFVRDAPAVNKEFFTQRCRDNKNNRMLHIHVFDFELIEECLLFCGFKPVYSQLFDMHQIVCGRKT